MKALLLSFDVEQFPSKELNLKLDEGTAFEVGNLGLRKVIGSLDTLQCRATFFVTAEFAERFPQSIRMLVRRGHEIALHGIYHEDSYARMEPGMTREMLSKGRIAMERHFKTPVVGFRGPRMSRPSYEMLAECGFKYDSSLHPTYVPGRYNNFTAPRNIHKREGITIVPVSVTPHLRLPFAWLWFRRMGLAYAKYCSRRVLSDTDFLNVYFHPWEFVEPPVEPKGITQRAFLGGCGQRNLNRLERFIRWTQRRGLEASTITGFLARKK